MQITSVNVKKFDKEDSKMKGIASVILDDCFVIRDIRIIEKEEGLFIAMPSRRKGDREYHDVAHPINQETRQMFEETILKAYETADSEE